MELTPNILEYAQGLPLAIKVVGSFLYNRDASQWRDSLGRLKKYPDKKEVTGVLQISFEPLRKEEREIFLHIACFFRGQREEYVKQILDVCGLHPQIGIPVLKERSLIAIENQEIHMHDMLQELGKKLVREKYAEDFTGCTNLTQVHPSIGLLKKLKYLLQCLPPNRVRRGFCPAPKG
ncbi:hypothetical protein PIB30_094311 [Stylosanthes scabra]|uniref:Disease resistance protein Roq1-like winged-helix domain-containing protein n=1 Tax=Stylosanthes scabra TaxID=79078 RepID=A0ABU6UXS9_9FABA|nr:hypothetical protein [Stylosanthes scabra]